MSSLAELQSEFAEALKDPARSAPRELVARSPSGSSRRFDVYRNNMVVSLVDALRATFPAVQRLVGEAYFAAAARVYVERYPPDSPVLLCYGARFGEVLEALPSASAVPYLGDVARLEWARRNALHAADADTASIQELARVAETDLASVTLALHPSLSLIRSRWPIVSLWSACLDTDSGGDVDMQSAETAVVVRPALEVAVRTAPAGGGDFLAALERGATLDEAAGRGADADDAFDLAAQLQFLFETGAVAAVHLPQQQDQP